MDQDKDQNTETFYHDGWRPFLSWTLIYLIIQNAIIWPFLNVVFKMDLPIIDWEDIIAISGIWLVVYGGGHTIKSIWGK